MCFNIYSLVCVKISSHIVNINMKLSEIASELCPPTSGTFMIKKNAGRFDDVRRLVDGSVLSDTVTTEISLHFHNFSDET